MMVILAPLAVLKLQDQKFLIPHQMLLQLYLDIRQILSWLIELSLEHLKHFLVKSRKSEIFTVQSLVFHKEVLFARFRLGMKIQSKF